MGTSPIPNIVNAMLDGLPAAFTAAGITVEVYDGFGTSNDPGNFVMIGVDDPDSATGRVAHGVQTYPLANGRSRNEEGRITSAAVAWVGDPDGMRQARTDVFAITSVIENWLRSQGAPPVFGLPNALEIGFGDTIDYMQDSLSGGVVATVIFAVKYKVRI